MADAAEAHCSRACASRISSFNVETLRASYRFKSLFAVTVAIPLYISQVGHFRLHSQQVNPLLCITKILR